MRSCRPDDFATILAIINEAAEAYRGVIPDDCWHDPYFTDTALRSEIDAGVQFSGCELDGALIGVMGIQTVRNVDLIRHAYVRPRGQGRGVGGAMLEQLRAWSDRQLLVGTWAAASWAIGLYERHGFVLVPANDAALLLRTYWTVSDRQIATSVVLAMPAVAGAGVDALMSEARW